jgi:hypothetical protein
MTLDDLGNIGELVAAVGVIVSLIYLARQIRQNTRSVQASAFQEAMRDVYAIFDLLASDADLSRIYWASVRDLDSVSPEERRRFASYMLGVFRRMENVVFQTQQGMLDPASWAGIRNTARRSLSQPGGAAWWSRAQDLFSPGFREYVDREIMPSDEDAV